MHVCFADDISGICPFEKKGHVPFKAADMPELLNNQLVQTSNVSLQHWSVDANGFLGLAKQCRDRENAHRVVMPRLHKIKWKGSSRPKHGDSLFMELAGPTNRTLMHSVVVPLEGRGLVLIQGSAGGRTVVCIMNL